MIRQKFADGTVVSSTLPYFSPRAASVPGPKLFERDEMPISYCRARVRAYITVHPVRPFSSSLEIPRVAPFPYVTLMNLWARCTISSAIEFLPMRSERSGTEKTAGTRLAAASGRSRHQGARGRPNGPDRGIPSAGSPSDRMSETPTPPRTEGPLRPSPGT